MKKALFLLAAIVCGCTQSQLPQEQKVTFHRDLVESGSMTRATAQEHNEIKTLIASTYKSFPLELYIDDNTVINIEFGGTYTIPIGTWYVTGSTTIQTLGQVTSSYTLAESPTLLVDTEVDIQWGVTDYSLPTEVKAAGILYNLEEVSEIQFKEFGTDTYKKVNTTVFSDHYGLFFINGYFNNTTAAYLKVIPTDGPKEETTFRFSTEYANEESVISVNLASGKYYILHPNAVTEIDGISFHLDTPDWECGLE